MMHKKINYFKSYSEDHFYDFHFNWDFGAREETLNEIIDLYSIWRTLFIT